MFWLIDSCQNSVSADQYCLTVSPAQVSTHRVQVFFEVICWQVATFQMIIGSSSIFLKCIWNKSCLWVVCYTAVFSVVTQRSSLQTSSWAALLHCKILISNWPRTRKFNRLFNTCREGNRFWLFSLSRFDHALRPIFMFWLVKDWQVSSCGKFMQRLEQGEGGKLLPVHSLKWNPNDVLTTCKAISKVLASGFVYWSCALRQKP